MAPDMSSKLVIVMAGLPARGKLYIAKKVLKYLVWLQYSCRVFNVGNTRRSAPDELEKSEATHNAAFFDHTNARNTAKREEWAMDTLDHLLDWLIDGAGSVAIFDATNTTKKRRRKVYNHIKSRSASINVLFLESICTNPELIERNIRMKLLGPDYLEMDNAQALKDFKDRLNNYERVYETIDPQLETANEGEAEEDDLSYVKVIDAGKKVISYNIKGFLSSQAVFYLLNINLTEKQIWLTRVGETHNDVEGIMGGDSQLTGMGHKYAKALAKFIKLKKTKFKLDQMRRAYVHLHDRPPASSHPVRTPTFDPNVSVFTSMTGRALETALYLTRPIDGRHPSDFQVKQLRMLNELSFGLLENSPAADFRNIHAEEFARYQENKLLYRFPGVGGESYLDVINRVRPLITELERIDNHVLLITHKVVTRILLAYFMNFDQELITDISIPSHSVYCLVPKPYGVCMEMYQYDETVDFFFRVPDEVMLRRGSVSTNDCLRPRFTLGGTLETMLESDAIYSSSDEEERDAADGSANKGVTEVRDSCPLVALFASYTPIPPSAVHSASCESFDQQIVFRELSETSVHTMGDSPAVFDDRIRHSSASSLLPSRALTPKIPTLSPYILEPHVLQSLCQLVFHDPTPLDT